jgi:hypothetical protein
MSGVTITAQLSVHNHMASSTRWVVYLSWEIHSILSVGYIGLTHHNRSGPSRWEADEPAAGLLHAYSNFSLRLESDLVDVRLQHGEQAMYYGNFQSGETLDLANTGVSRQQGLSEGSLLKLHPWV